MITVRKLEKLKESTRMRKVIHILESKEYSPDYIVEMIQLIIKTSQNKRVISAASRLLNYNKNPTGFQREIFSLKSAIQDEVGIVKADWDLNKANGKEKSLHSQSSRNSKRFPISLFLDDIRSPYNIGSIFRNADAFGVKNLILTEDCPPPTHSRAKRTAMGSVENLPYQTINFDKKIEFLKSQLEEVPIFALELGGTEISQFNFPTEGIAILGSEELGVSPQILEIVDKSLGRVSIPMLGNKGSLNVSVASGILLNRWSEFLLAKDDNYSV